MKRSLSLLISFITITLLLSGCFGEKVLFNIAVEGEGIVRKSIDDQGKGYKKGAAITLEATPATGWRFSHFEGDLESSEKPVSIVLDHTKVVKAVFVKTVMVISPIRVPQDYATIQGAINAASIGDTVIVSPGTYYENIDFKGKSNITLTSTDPSDPTVVNSTIINGN